jgi:2-polyprenyl-3-methyl-5-hydroxy-6-metoxy-1,4-benzoquinol methylase
MDTKQNFELYADTKRFSAFSTGAWATHFEEARQISGRTLDELRFLDVGCGDGKYFNYLRNCGLSPANIHGTEASQKRIERCREIGWENAVHVPPGTALPYPDGHFHIVNLMEVIEHVPMSMAPALVSEIRRVTSKDGVLLLSTPNYPIKRFYDLYHAVRFRKWARLRDDPTHVTWYNHAKLAALLQPHFRVIAERPYRQGFLFDWWPLPVFRHKIFYLCHNGTAPAHD